MRPYPAVNNIFAIKSSNDFNTVALQVFNYQSVNNPIYREYIKHLGVIVSEVKSIAQIPFLPIAFFKHHLIISGNSPTQIIFKSSGTTASAQSKHHVSNVKIYEQSYTQAFNYFYGNIKNTCILALLPNYLERDGSSLIYMVNDLIAKSEHPQSGFFLYNTDELLAILGNLKSQNQKTILIGVTFALLDFVEKHTINFPELIVIETGGMKGKRKEMIREELHELLKKGLGVSYIHSEYGMTELLSQAYSSGDGIFKCPKWMQIFIRDTNDPLALLENGKTGGINVIDLANIHSCSFIATQDVGKKHAKTSFEVLGRFDNSDIRGCNLMLE
ncbi:MAG: acyl transferase [Sphingobacteriales bacterium]|nr:MAG: acyl transferase [Sphingobacteriales bacterium]TAF78603.1 MAG: acyl transferase [Sphingobacteriales bacterium]